MVLTFVLTQSISIDLRIILRYASKEPLKTGFFYLMSFAIKSVMGTVEVFWGSLPPILDCKKVVI